MSEISKVAYVLLGVISVPIIILIISISNTTTLAAEDAAVQKTVVNDFEYYFDDEYVCSNTFTFDSVTFTHKNYAEIQWVSYNATHYQLNISCTTKERTPSGYMLIFASNRFSYNLSVTIGTEVFTVNKTNVDSYDTFVITYITLENMQKLTINVDIELKNTHNSDSGDVSVYGNKQFDVVVSDPAHNDDLASMLSILTVVSILSIIGLAITSGILVKKGMG